MKPTLRSRSILRGICLSILLACPALWAQNLGSITGLVTDPNDAVIPGAQVRIREVGTNLTREAKTASAGLFTFSTLPVGTYELNVAFEGFQSVRVSDLKLDVNGHVRIDVRMTLGQVTQTVEVEGGSPLLKTEDASLGQVIEQKRVTELPLNGRDFQQLQLLTPGAVSTFNFQTTQGLSGGASSLSTTMTMNVANGNRPGNVLFLIDGSNASNQFGRGIVMTPAIDEIQEFSFQTSNMTAEFGYGTSAVNVSIKSGTNELHGVGYNFLRNNALDARSFFATRVEPLKQNQFGGNIGGPVILPGYNGKNRTFWFFSYEGLQLRTGATRGATVPTARMRTGDFSELPNALFDPASTQQDPSNPNIYRRSPFPGNVIPSNRIDPVAKFFLAPEWIPLPLQPGINANLRQEVSVPSRYHQITTKIDQRFGSRDSLFGRISSKQATEGSYGVYHGLSPLDPGSNPKNPDGSNTALGWTHVFNPTNVLEVRGAYTRSQILFNTPNVQATDYTTDVLKIQGYKGISSQYPSYPRMNIPGFTGMPRGFVLNYISKQVELSANYTVIRGRHTFRMGNQYRHYDAFGATSGNGSGSFNFNGDYTSNPVSAGGSGSPLADFYLGIPASADRQIPTPGFTRLITNNGAYLNDDWKVSSKLTLILGIRFEYNTPVYSPRDQLSGFDPNARNGRGAILLANQAAIDPPFSDSAVPNGIAAYKSLFVFAKDTGVSEKYLRDMNFFRLTYWLPRVGLAYRLNNKTVVRSAYGMYTTPYDMNKGLSLGVPWSVSERENLNQRYDSVKTIQTLLPAGSAYALIPGIGATNLLEDKDLGYVQQWNIAVQRELPGRFSFDVAYVGTKGTRLQRGYGNPNTPRPGPGPIQPRRPWPDFGNIGANENSASSIYHALQTRVERRFHLGLSLLGSFTWAKSIDDDSSATNIVYDQYNRRRDRGQSDFNLPRVFTLGLVYELPWMRTAKGIQQTVLGGWTVGAIATLQDGFPYTPLFNGDPANAATPSRADVVAGCNPVPSNPTPQRWINTNCFVAPPGAPDYRLGNAGRNILRGDSFRNMDLSLYKGFSFSERKILQLRFEGFNALNQHSFQFPNATVNSSIYGTVTGSSPGRILQVAAKFNF